MKEEHAYTFGTYAKLRNGNFEYVSQVGTYVTSEDNSRHVILQIAKILHRAYCDIFIDAIDDVFMEKPVGFYGEKED